MRLSRLTVLRLSGLTVLRLSGLTVLLLNRLFVPRLLRLYGLFISGLCRLIGDSIIRSAAGTAEFIVGSKFISALFTNHV